MPLYDFENTETGEVSEIFLSIAKKAQYLEDNPHMKSVLTSAPKLVSGLNLQKKQNADAGWQENLSRIAEAHPNSAFAAKHGGRSIKESKTADVKAKHNIGDKSYSMDL